MYQHVRPNRNLERVETSGMDLIGEAMDLVRTAPPGVVVGYFVGTVPFVLGFLFFWADMSSNGFARQRCLWSSLGVTLLFVWMKCWHAVFAAGLNAHLAELPRPRWNTRRVVKMVAGQLAVQPHGLWAVPAAILLLFPYHSVHAFFQNLTVLGNGGAEPIKVTMRKAWKQSLLWPGQNWTMLWLIAPWTLALAMILAFGVGRLVASALPDFYSANGPVWFWIMLAFAINFAAPLCPFGAVVAGNVAVTIALLPAVLYALLGVETVFTQGGINSVFNTTFLATTYALSFLCLDPIVKAAHTIRCFRGGSLTTGEDLLMELRDARK